MTSTERETLRAGLAACGFDEVRFASAATPVAGAFDDWLAAGHQADMQWLARGRDKRHDPALILPGVRTIIALGVNYLPADPALAAQTRLAKYALYSDYHDTIGDGLRKATTLLGQTCGLVRDDHRAYVDTGPVLERGWAATAGIGWQGKNAMLLSRTHGNWLFLAAILTRADIAPDREVLPPPRLAHHCGSCTRCLDACPTDAFPQPGQVDARRCIAYHTIENRGVIPREFRAPIGPRVFGCDTCLDVCPWNRFAQAGRSALLHARTELAALSLLDLLTLDESRFAELFRKSPIKRSKLAGILRNACIAAGNWDDSREWHFGGAEDRSHVVSAVEKLCAHESPLVRTHAVWALHRLLGVSEASARLAEVRGRETDAAVLTEYAAWT